MFIEKFNQDGVLLSNSGNEINVADGDWWVTKTNFYCDEEIHYLAILNLPTQALNSSVPRGIYSQRYFCINQFPGKGDYVVARTPEEKNSLWDAIKQVQLQIKHPVSKRSLENENSNAPLSKKKKTK